MTGFYRIASLSLVVISLMACKKKSVPQIAPEIVTGNARAVIVNKISDSIYVTLSGHDIITGTIPHLIRLTLAPMDTVVIPRANLINAYRYQYSWYSADYTYSDWHMADGNGRPLRPSFDYYADTTDYRLEINGTRRNELLICMDGNGISSVWTVVNAYNSSGVSVWDTLPENRKKHDFVMSRFHTIKHSYIDSTNKAVSNNLSFTFDLSAQRMWLGVFYTSDSFVLSNDMQTVVPLSTQALDTLYYSRIAKDSTGTTIYPPPYYKVARTSVEK